MGSNMKKSRIEKIKNRYLFASRPPPPRPCSEPAIKFVYHCSVHLRHGFDLFSLNRSMLVFPARFSCPSLSKQKTNRRVLVAPWFRLRVNHPVHESKFYRTRDFGGGRGGHPLAITSLTCGWESSYFEVCFAFFVKSRELNEPPSHRFVVASDRR